MRERLTELLSGPFPFGITREGAVYLFAVSVIAFSALNTGNNLLYLILAAMLAAVIVSGAISRINLHNLSISLQVPEELFAGETAALKITVRNHKRFFPTFSLFVEGGRDRRSARQAAVRRKILSRGVYFSIVPARHSVSQSLLQVYPERGRYGIDGFIVSTRSPFGFFRRARRITAEGEVVVYPRIRDISSFFHLLPFLEGHIESLRRGRGEELYSHRGYEPGDDARLLDWKATAKLGRMMLREFAKQEERRVYIYFDSAIYPGQDDRFRERFEEGVSIAASLAAHFVVEGAEVSFALPGTLIGPASGRPHLWRILELLAVIEPEAAARGDGLPGEPDLSKLFSIIITSRPRGTFPSSIWRSSHVIYF